jgi:hypothetical protein
MNHHLAVMMHVAVHDDDMPMTHHVVVVMLDNYCLGESWRGQYRERSQGRGNQNEFTFHHQSLSCLTNQQRHLAHVVSYYTAKRSLR